MSNRTLKVVYRGGLAPPPAGRLAEAWGGGTRDSPPQVQFSGLPENWTCGPIIVDILRNRDFGEYGLTSPIPQLQTGLERTQFDPILLGLATSAHQLKMSSNPVILANSIKSEVPDQ